MIKEETKWSETRALLQPALKPRLPAAASVTATPNPGAPAQCWDWSLGQEQIPPFTTRWQRRDNPARKSCWSSEPIQCLLHQSSPSPLSSSLTHLTALFHHSLTPLSPDGLSSSRRNWAPAALAGPARPSRPCLLLALVLLLFFFSAEEPVQHRKAFPV